MKIYDISQEVFSCKIYPGDPKPEKQILSATAADDLYNLSAFYMCAHNGTHLDAPYHFIKDGIPVDKVELSKTIGFAYVAEHLGNLTREDAKEILRKASSLNGESAKRILIKGKATVTLEAAEVFAEAKIDLVGNESQTVGPEDGPMPVHKVLLGANIVLLEGIRLSGVEEGVYFLSAAPLSLLDSDGAPCRAVLVKF
ncbi:MAG: cyclase family protein [Clostridia bacterium]|nr:cyclase family protein [Clostridia bacterium]